MSRKFIVTIHLAFAAFFSPVLLVVAISGGLYLIGEKGDVIKEEIYKGELAGYDFMAKDRESMIRQFLKTNNIDHEFEYAKGGDQFTITRPTSKQHLAFELKQDQLIVTKRTPNFIFAIIELHKGHGPTAFKTYQKMMAIGLIVILASGLYLGLLSPGYRRKTIVFSGLGLVSMLVLAYF